ncbi:MAG TPA: serine hydrolase domain-containing protein [Vicinamibacterales bacterium]
MIRTLILTLALALVVAVPQAQRQDDAALTAAYAEVDHQFNAFMASRHVPGAAWGVVVNGELAHTGVSGLRDLPSRSPVDADSVFRIASMTKSFTAISILKLRDEGKLSLDDPAERYVPEMAGMKYPTSDAPRITIRHLMSHATGFPEDNPWGDQQLADTEDQLSQMLKSGIPFSNAPGIAYEYSNLGFAILGRVVANVSKTRYPDYVSTNVLKPLGMSSTTLEPSSVPVNRLVHGYRWEDDQWKNEPLLSNGSFGSMGGMLTSVRDLSRYVAMFLSAWPPHDGPETAPIRRSSLREMQHLWSPALSSVARDRATGTVQLTSGGYGYGLRVAQNCAFKTIVSHTGGLPGFGSAMVWLPDYGVGIVAFGNLTYTGWFGVVTTALETLTTKGGLHPRMPAASPALVSARGKVATLVAGWDDRLADSVASPNLFLDESRDRRHAEIDRLRATVGACTPGSGFDTVENALRGSWTMTCERGKLEVAITLAPTMPPTVQFMSVRLAPPAPSRTESCAQ